jgi:hypothetical protein
VPLTDRRQHIIGFISLRAGQQLDRVHHDDAMASILLMGKHAPEAHTVIVRMVVVQRDDPDGLGIGRGRAGSRRRRRRGSHGKYRYS